MSAVWTFHKAQLADDMKTAQVFISFTLIGPEARVDAYFWALRAEARTADHAPRVSDIKLGGAELQFTLDVSDISEESSLHFAENFGSLLASTLNRHVGERGTDSAFLFQR